MTPQERLFGAHHAFDNPLSLWLTMAVLGLLVVATLVLRLAGAKFPEKLRTELWARTITWWIITPIMIGCVLLGAAWTMGLVLTISLLAFSDYARATGLFRDHGLCATVVAGIILVQFAALDHWYNLFLALSPLFAAIIPIVAILPDNPKGYIQRVALALFAFLLFGACLGHLGFTANDVDYRPRILLLIVAVELNDVLAYIAGKTFGHRKLAPNTSPNKTLAGSLGALIGITALVYWGGHYAYRGTIIDQPRHLIILGILTSVMGQLGDLTVSSIKRDLGIKDMGTILPGHGGFLDRFNSLLFVAPAVYHYVGAYLGWGLDQPIQILTGGH